VQSGRKNVHFIGVGVLELHITRDVARWGQERLYVNRMPRSQLPDGVIEALSGEKRCCPAR
jgi:hypothetical protein